jgi:serine/threonine protein kinase
MLTGLPPFYCRDREKLFEKIRTAELTFPKFVSANAQSLLSGLLTRDPTKRLGSGEDDAAEVKRHPFFAGEVNWDLLMKGEGGT